ncbi:MAG: histidinol dehydrogenase [Microbacterium pygmaeum]|uniref:Histidinol dehydrogenase n=1 Tax=Microbacterium pygmaeum TaxID=370764 RepID=A0A1G7ZF76_9MICO|nr:histidinol dehydrogenase [Microbacterium pygmaeum]SDH06750.1 hypothetical protein SAMN04489810_2024 [Microbacterium pygmaeum]
MNSSLPARLGTWVVALVVGIVYGLAGTIAHSFSWGPLPIGLILAILGSAALLAAVRLLTSDRWSALATGLGMMVATLVFSGRGPGGSVIVPQTSLAIAWTIAVPILVAVVVAWPEGIASARAGTPAPADADARSN